MARGVHRERPAAPLALGHVGHLPDSDVGVEPVGVVRRQLQAHVRARRVTEHENPRLAEFLAQPRHHFFGVTHRAYQRGTGKTLLINDRAKVAPTMTLARTVKYSSQSRLIH